ncbi:MAG: radical SAM protein [Myxococcales bacterium]|nr:radical SAM protein [Myxococcales bacterium]
MSEHPVISERDRQEASAVTLKGSGAVYEIQLGHLCNNRCVFCSSGMLTEQGVAKPVPLADIFAAIDRARDAGARRLVFVGGEPTLHKGFLPALAHTVARGFEEIVIFTNGVLLPQPGFIDKCLALGDFEWRISIQGADEASHVAVTKRPQSYKRIMAGLAELARRGQRVTMNMCVNAHSYESLPAYPELVAEHGITQIHVDVIRPASTGRRSLIYFQEIMPAYSVMAPHIEAMLDGFEAAALRDPTMAAVEVGVGNLPHCTLRRWPGAIVHGGEDTITVASDTGGLEPDVDKYAWHATMRRHLPVCEGCVLKGECTGVFGTYLELHGEGEFAAFDEAELLALPPARRPFLALARRSLRQLLERQALEGAPAGFVCERVLEDRHGRMLLLTFAADGGGRVTLRFESPERSGDAVWADDGAPLVLRTPTWSLALVVDPQIGEEGLALLLHWALADAGERALDCWRRAGRFTTARDRGRRILRRLRELAPPGWTWDPKELGAWREDGHPEIGLRLQGEGETLEVLFTLSEGGLELDFRGDDRARGLIPAVLGMIKSIGPG